ncbi:low affinity iron permease family protein [Chryseobacterium aquaticum]|uniref:low affinity iron permease family protein n=1 Tax=Chryseobacterium aquaticum TaxID=452084 RepID=UPI002FCB4813
MKKSDKSIFEKFANWATKFTGSSFAFITAVSIVLIWAVTGPVFKYSETWQLVINTGTTIITFLMVFLIQKSQNKDSKAIQIKLNELIAANEKATNRIVDIEDLTEKELDQLHCYYESWQILPKKMQIFMLHIP